MNHKTRFSRAIIVATAGLSIALKSGAAIADCSPAHVWASPRVVNYGTVIRDAEENPTEPNLTVFIELADGSLADPSSITLNGLPALPEPSAEGDENGNAIADLMVKFNRSALLTTAGLLRIAGTTASGGCFTGETHVEIRCLPETVERSDYFIDFTTSDMPDPQFNGLPAQLDVHRVKPVFPRGCGNISPIRALVLVHGRTLPAASIFDLRYQDYSLMESLAMRGIDTFAADHLGFGFSSLLGVPNPLDNPCNASLPQCTVAPGAICTPTAQCDCRQGLPATQSMDQQGSTRYLFPQPLDARCSHTTNARFQRVTDQVAQLDLVVNDALAKTGLEQVHLLGISFGGPVVGKYLGDEVSRQANVAGAIILASIFKPAPDAASPTGGTWPLALIDRADAMANFNLAAPVCPGQLDPGIPDALWTAVQARDPVAREWGPRPYGLSRYPIVPRFDWDETVTNRIEVPTLVMNGFKDSVVPVGKSVEIYRSLASESKVLVQLSCASHLLLLESCSTPGCVPPRANVQKHVADWILAGKIFTDRGHDNGSFESAPDGTLVQTATR